MLFLIVYLFLYNKKNVLILELIKIILFLLKKFLHFRHVINFKIYYYWSYTLAAIILKRKGIEDMDKNINLFMNFVSQDNIEQNIHYYF